MRIGRPHPRSSRLKDLLRWGCLLAVPIALSLLTGPALGGWTTFTAADGLAGNDALCILQDDSGALWFGTESGVTRYDGWQWTTFTTADGLAGNRVSAMLQDDSGALWFGTLGSGVSRFDGGRWTTFSTEDGLAGNEVLSILQDHSGALWFGTWGNGVSRFDGEHWTTFDPGSGAPDIVVKSMLQDDSGVLWFATWGGGVSRFDGQQWMTYTVADGLASNMVSSVIQDDSGAIWFGTPYGASRFDGEHWRTVTSADGLIVDNVISMLQDRWGALWFVSYLDGISRFDGQHWSTITTADGLAGSDVQSILQDDSGAIWFVTYGFGVSRFDGQHWKKFTVADGLVSDNVIPMFQDSTGALWCASYGSGISRYDSDHWTTFPTGDELPADRVTSVIQDNSGAIWVATDGFGVGRFDGRQWRVFTTAHGLASNEVRRVLQDDSGALWFGTRRGVSRYDGERWTSFTTADGLADNDVSALLQDDSGAYWFGTSGYGVSRFDGQHWMTYTVYDGLAENLVNSILQDDSGALWFATSGSGVSRFDGQHWMTYTVADGLASNLVSSILQDDSGALWFATWGGGVSRFDGERWMSLTTADGLTSNFLGSMLQDRAGTIWFGTQSGLNSFSTDRVYPETVIQNPPPLLTPSRNHNLIVSAAYREVQGIDFSYSLDDAPWSAWLGLGSLSLSFPSLGDGMHVVRVRARDLMGNIDPTPAVARFEIDGTPPTPILTSPTSGQVVRDTQSIAGTAIDARFQSYRLQYASADGALAGTLATSTVPATDEILTRWNTASVPDGVYELRLSVIDTLGLSGTAVVQIVVDNAFPSAEQTSPASVSATLGGDVYTTHGEAHAFFPPNAFARDVTVSISRADTTAVPASLPGGARHLLPGYAINWGGASLDKTAVLDMAVPGAGPSSTPDPPGFSGDPAAVAIYRSSDGSSWVRLGGTRESAEGRISTPIALPGLYALYVEDSLPPGDRSLSALTLSPRVLSPQSTPAGQGVAIGFRLGSASPVTIKVYNRAGRLVRNVMDGETLGPGNNVVRWNARDDDGGVIPDGIYLLTVESRGERLVKSIAVAR